MRHQTASELLALYSIDALEEEASAAVEAHLTTCPPCRVELGAYAAAAAALAGEMEPGPHVWQGILARIEAF